MPNLSQFHPQVVHFVVALLFVGVGMRIVSLTGKLKFTNHAAATLLIMGAVASWFAVKSGTDAHGPVERIPGARELVIEHEEHGKTTRNVFLIVAAIEIAALALARKETLAKYGRFALFGSAIVGAYGAFQLYEAAEHGGELVYSYGGGPGLRTGDPEDTKRMLMAALYNQSQADRKAGKGQDAVVLVNEMARRFPGDTTVRFLQVESMLRDAKDYPAALLAVNAISMAPTDARWRARQATLKADIYLAMGSKDSARAVLAPVVAAFPQNSRLKAKLDSLR